MNAQVHNAPAEHFESFDSFAAPELARAAPWVFGVCFNAGCSRPFELGRPWARFCCDRCRRSWEAECRTMGARIALPTLAHALHKHAAPGSPEADICRAARRFIARTARDWRMTRSGLIERASTCK